ncbi:hypothetical protein [Schaalia cardiffensis]|uniref:hypothetical protein n=1 Tax=Schaalia cardiffensis TaxID=181487 RepID=UPI0023F3AF12|nr:hypothetical protein [Schaalia cardiffensis]
MGFPNEAAWLMWQMCNWHNMGYSQPKRLHLWPGGNADCSSAVAHAYNESGCAPPFPSSTWTGSIRAEAAARGFTILDYAAVGPNPDNYAVGDALLSEGASGGTGHVAMITGYGEISEFWISETGDIDGEDGDQTGNESRSIALSDHPNTWNGTWTHVLRPPMSYGQADTATPTTKTLDTATGRNLTNMAAPSLIRADLPDGTYAYALCYFQGVGGARTIDQEEANVWYPITGVSVVSYEKWWKLAERAWEANNAMLEAMGQQVAKSVADAVADLRREMEGGAK